MSKPFPYWLRLSIVSSLSVLLSFNPAFAGRLIHRAICGHSSYRSPAQSVEASDCCFPAPPVTCGCEVPACGEIEVLGECCGSVESSGWSSATVESIPVPSCGCNAVSPESMGHAPEMGQTHSVQPAVPPVVPEISPTPAVPPPVTPIAPPKTDSTNPTDKAAPSIKEAPSQPVEEPKVDLPKSPAADDLSAPQSSSPIEPAAPKTEPADLFSPSEPAVKPSAPPADDLFAPPATTPPATPPADDLFAPPATTPPATTPADDLFAPPATTPAAPPADDLFAPPAATPPAVPATDDLFAPPPTTPPAVPSTDDLFAPPASEPSMKPAAPAAADDIFGTNPPANSATPAAPADDLFAPTPSETTPATPPGASDLDNLFKSTNNDPKSEFPPEDSKPVSADVESEPNFDDLFANPAAMSNVEAGKTKPATSEDQPASKTESGLKSKDVSFEDLFKSTSTQTDNRSNVHSQDAFQGAEMREWVDNTGDYSVNARLVVIYPDRVRLIKENGKFTSVPMSRLSGADRDYVNWVAISLGTKPTAKLVNTDANSASRAQETAR